MVNASSKYKTEKRVANVGERILIVAEYMTSGKYRNGDVLTVRRVDGDMGVGVKEHSQVLLHREYEVIIEESPSKHNENLVLTRLFHAEAVIDELKRKVAKLEAGQTRKALIAETIDEHRDTLRRLAETKSPNQRRADVIERAKAFVEDLEKRAIGGARNYDGNSLFNNCLTKLTFHVNADKGVVTALARDTLTGKAFAKAFARCAPGDVFNADIGKAIAAGRLYGVDIPQEFLDAPQPTEVVVGMRVERKDDGGKRVVSQMRPDIIKTSYFGGGKAFSTEGNLTWLAEGQVNIIEDTDAVYE